MPHAPREGTQPTAASHQTAIPAFAGFALPTSNTTYCPNQFFDVLLPHAARGAVRIVAYMLRKTLGWCDAEGRPQRERFCIGYGELEAEAGVSREMIRTALAEAEKGGFIRCLQKPAAKGRGSAGASGMYELRWDLSPEYVKDPKRFRGFFAGEGNRTYIPNQFFDYVVRHEPLAVVKVVGSIIRFSIGFQTKWGHRRQQVALSYLDIQRYAGIASRTTLAKTIEYALAAHYIRRVEAGYFDPHGGIASKAATYAIRWLNDAVESSIGQKSVPANASVSDRSETCTGIGQKSVPADRSEKCTGLQIKQRNNTLKQSAETASLEELQKIGFDRTAAEAMAARFSAERILRQIEWLALRRVRTNRLGLLRRAIEEDWPRPGRGRLGQPNSAIRGQSLSESIDALRQRFSKGNSTEI